MRHTAAMTRQRRQTDKILYFAELSTLFMVKKKQKNRHRRQISKLHRPHTHTCNLFRFSLIPPSSPLCTDLCGTRGQITYHTHRSHTLTHSSICTVPSLSSLCTHTDHDRMRPRLLQREIFSPTRVVISSNNIGQLLCVAARERKKGSTREKERERERNSFEGLPVGGVEQGEKESIENV